MEQGVRRRPATADLTFVTARALDGLGVFAVDDVAEGVARTPLDVLDPTRPLARVEFAGSPCGADPAALLRRVRHRGRRAGRRTGRRRPGLPGHGGHGRAFGVGFGVVTAKSRTKPR
jgi:hypothetical protein